MGGYTARQACDRCPSQPHPPSLHTFIELHTRSMSITTTRCVCSSPNRKNLSGTCKGGGQGWRVRERTFPRERASIISLQSVPHKYLGPVRQRLQRSLELPLHSAHQSINTGTGSVRFKETPDRQMSDSCKQATMMLLGITHQRRHLGLANAHNYVADLQTRLTHHVPRLTNAQGKEERKGGRSRTAGRA